jgi:hypothetical protein
VVLLINRFLNALLMFCALILIFHLEYIVKFYDLYFLYIIFINNGIYIFTSLDIYFYDIVVKIYFTKLWLVFTRNLPS